MSEMDVKIKPLPAIKVASILGFGSGPELEAWEKMFQFLKGRGFWEQMEGLEFYGFNNPDPMPGSPNYGTNNGWLSPKPLRRHPAKLR